MDEWLRLTHCTVHLEDGRVCTDDGGVSRLLAKELSLLRYLLARKGRVAKREELLVDVFGYSPRAISRTVDMTVQRLRSKIEANPKEPVHLLSIRGIGYQLDLTARSEVGTVLPIPMEEPQLRLLREASVFAGWFTTSAAAKVLGETWEPVIARSAAPFVEHQLDMEGNELWRVDSTWRGPLWAEVARHRARRLEKRHTEVVLAEAERWAREHQTSPLALREIQRSEQDLLAISDRNREFAPEVAARALLALEGVWNARLDLDQVRVAAVLDYLPRGGPAWTLESVQWVFQSRTQRVWERAVATAREAEKGRDFRAMAYAFRAAAVVGLPEPEHMEEAKDWLERAREAWLNAGEPELAMETLGGLGQYYRRIGEYDRAEEAFRTVLANANNPNERPAKIANLARVVLSRGYWEEAEALCQDQLALANSYQLGRYVAIATLRMAQLASIGNDEGRALNGFQQAKEAYQRMKDSAGVGLVCGATAEHHLARGRWSAAKSLISLAKGTGIAPQMEAELEGMLALGERRYGDALQFFSLLESELLPRKPWWQWWAGVLSGNPGDRPPKPSPGAEFVVHEFYSLADKLLQGDRLAAKSLPARCVLASAGAQNE